MTQARMLQLKDSLESFGWEISPETGVSNLFTAFEDQITWVIFNSRSEKKKELVFYLFDHLGRRTEKLSDIHYVLESGSGLKLYFSKITSNEWRADLKAFVHSTL